MRRNYLLALSRLLNRKDWNCSFIWPMLDLVVRDLDERNDADLSHKVFHDIYLAARKCKSATELEDILDDLTY